MTGLNGFLTSSHMRCIRKWNYSLRQPGFFTHNFGWLINGSMQRLSQKSHKTQEPNDPEKYTHDNRTMPSLISEKDLTQQKRMVESNKRMVAADALGALASLASSAPAMSDTTKKPQQETESPPQNKESEKTEKRESPARAGEESLVEQPPAEASKENSPKEPNPNHPPHFRPRSNEHSPPHLPPRASYGAAYLSPSYVGGYYPPPPHYAEHPPPPPHMYWHGPPPPYPPTE
eukprot:CAMPEP_0116836998 /NCGR_PEP_ID=MMETSP0418-20121206/8413_1 /TAXON_ID=1158023 /ORGANISM="Astrosyne radiata, Strain 13vi08-1A" /LENGTH=231 /DNA_ID=CAMNT_0004466841 /DNA_START=25 /DNA_END=717 /DNA_ORIENTATION=+